MLLYHTGFREFAVAFHRAGGVFWDPRVWRTAVIFVFWAMFVRFTQSLYAFVDKDTKYLFGFIECAEVDELVRNDFVDGTITKTPDLIFDDVIHRRCPTLDVLCLSKAPDTFYAANSGGSLTSGISVLQKSLFICAIWMLNFRMNNAWNRYWQGVTHVQLMFAKWGDAFTQICTFIDVTLEQDCNRGTRSDLEAVRREFAHLFSLMSAMATDRLLSGDIVMAQRVEENKIATEGSKKFSGEPRDARKKHGI